MNVLLEYLKSAKTSFSNDLNSYSEIHIVIGNESCDLDSTVSPLTLAFLLNKRRISEISATALIIPVLNVTREQFLLRTENCFVLQECGIPLEILIYRDEVNIEEILKAKHLTASLIDHHVLSKNDEVLLPTVIQIFDHRPLDVNSNWETRNVKLRIEQVGSCSTLIADEIIRVDENILDTKLAYMIYETIVYDTVALLPENGRAKELDLYIAKKLEGKFQFTEDKQFVFDKLWTAHNDVSHLSPGQILLKDLKLVENIPVPGLPMLVENFLKLQDTYKAVENLACKYDVPVLIIIGLEAFNSNVERDVGIFFRNDGVGLKDKLLEKFNSSEKAKGYDFQFDQVPTNYCNVICLKQNNIKLSRKQIIPLIKDTLIEYKLENV